VAHCIINKISKRDHKSNENHRNIKIRRRILQKISKAGIRTEDINYISVYGEYCQMKAAGDKITYIVATSPKDTASAKGRFII